MINQISPVQTKTGAIPTLNRSLLQARHIQVAVKERNAAPSLPTTVEIWSPLTAGPFIVPVTRWIE